MRKFIHSDFELDLSMLKITDNVENSWFTGNYFTKYSYPFQLPLTDEYEVVFGFISHSNSTNRQTLFEGLYAHGDVMEKAVLEIEELGQAISLTLRYGFDEFPNFEKKLNELSLMKFEVPNIYQHAKNVIVQEWPAVNYNFPQIHCEKISNPEDDDVWFAFQNIVNNYKNGQFLVNDVDTAEDITYNRNIMQPLPYLLYLIKAGIEEAGFTLHGDILEDETFRKTLVYTEKEYYSTVAQTSIPMMIMAEDFTQEMNLNGTPFRIYSKTYAIPQPGKYRIVGTVYLRDVSFTSGSARLYYRNTLIDSVTWYGLLGQVIASWSFDQVVETLSDLNEDYVRLEITCGANGDFLLADGNINPIRYHDDSGTPIPSIINLNQVDLTRAVPDMQFGDLVKAALALKNMDIEKRGREIWINYKQRAAITSDIVDLSYSEVKHPEKKFFMGNSFLLKYQDINSEQYKFAEIFQSKAGIFTTNFVKDDKTSEIPISAIPLPLLTRNGVQSAHAFVSDQSKPMLVLYAGLSNGLNLAEDNSPLLIPNLHALYYKDWFSAQINSVSVKWTFLTYFEFLSGLNIKSRVHAYSNIHLVKSIQKTEVQPGLFEVEIDVALLE